MFVPHAVKPLSIDEINHLVAGILLVASILYYFISSHSVVYLRYPRRVGVARWLEDHKPEIIVGVICVLTGAIATRIVERAWK